MLTGKKEKSRYLKNKRGFHLIYFLPSRTFQLNLHVPILVLFHCILSPFLLKKFVYTILYLSFFFQVQAQIKQVAITIDDLPNAKLYDEEVISKLLYKLDSMRVPITVFINEKFVDHSENGGKVMEMLEAWGRSPLVELANHTYSHQKYSKSDLQSYQEDILKGEKYSKEISRVNQKPYEYIRFPYNDLGKDSIQHMQMRAWLSRQYYTIAPFTVESADWLFNSVYKHTLQNEAPYTPQQIGQMYVDKSMELFHFFDSLSLQKYERSIPQIYLCHDNELNTDYLIPLIDSLKQEGYALVSMREALKDAAYSQEDSYFEKWGISWFYRWMPSTEERGKWMRAEPRLEQIQSISESIKK